MSNRSGWVETQFGGIVNLMELASVDLVPKVDPNPHDYVTIRGLTKGGAYVNLAMTQRSEAEYEVGAIWSFVEGGSAAEPPNFKDLPGPFKPS